MKQSATPSGKPPARRRAARLFALALTLLALALALPAGAAASPGAAAAPTITSFTPHTGPVGTVVLLMGSGFTGARRVTLGRAEAAFTVHSDESIVLTVPAGALSGPISVTTPEGSAVSAGSFSVTLPPMVITVTAPTGTGSYAQGSSLTVSWTVSSAVAEGEFALGVRSPTGGWQIGKLVPASGAASYAAGLTLDVHPGSGYKVMVAWRPVVGSGSWSAYATSPGSFAVTAGPAAKAITAFSFQGLTPPVTGVINEAAHAIALTVPHATDVHALVATFTTTGESVTVGPWTQFSGVTANDFSSPVTYKVTGADGSTQDYTVTVTVTPLAIGDAYGGGVVAYILQSGDPGYSATVVHGLIAATHDQDSGSGIRWYNGSSTTTGATATALGTGSANTTAIIASQGATATSYAAGLARAYNGGGYNDWYLPSKDELFHLYLNRHEIGGLDTHRYPYYWSSSEIKWSMAWFQNFDNGSRNGSYKSDTLSVRAVRTF